MLALCRQSSFLTKAIIFQLALGQLDHIGRDKTRAFALLREYNSSVFSDASCPSLPAIIFTMKGNGKSSHVTVTRFL